VLRARFEQHIVSIYVLDFIITTSLYVAISNVRRYQYAVLTGLNAGTFHPGIAHALATVTAVLSTTHSSPKVSLLRSLCVLIY